MQNSPLIEGPVPRIVSIDVLRGLTMIIVVIQGEVAALQNVPGWAKHAGTPDTMTFVDVILPVFLFVVGMSIPLALDRRRAAGQSTLQIWQHVLLRTLSLLIIGIGLGNMRLGRSSMLPIGMSGELWTVLLLASFILIWNRYPLATGRWKNLAWILRSSGIALLVYLAVIYREETKGQIHWLACRFYIIGIIGWAYLIGCSIYLLFQRELAAVVGCLTLLICVYIEDEKGLFDEYQFFIGPYEHTRLGWL